MNIIVDNEELKIKFDCAESRITDMKELASIAFGATVYGDDYVTSAGGLTIQIPAVGMTNRYINVSKKIPLTKHNLMVRDKGRCQYCYEKLSDSIDE